MASYDGNARNSGIIAIAPGGGRIVTPHFRDRYNSLIDSYGSEFTPPLNHNDGIETWSRESEKITEYKIDREHHIKFGIMQQWKRDGRKPTGTLKRLLRKL